ncbi:MAG: helix-turn-helix transcriptional regulator [Eubacteriales bacterium]|nr:helix-turn-helix transcriptional regulator [Eubacteriales bacterium]
MLKPNIEKYLDAKGMTQRELAEKVGTTETSISRYVSGERIPKAPMCIKIAKALDTDVEMLFADEPEPQAMANGFAQLGLVSRESFCVSCAFGYQNDKTMYPCKRCSLKPTFYIKKEE